MSNEVMKQNMRTENHGMRHRNVMLVIAFLIAHFSFLTSSAQTFTQQIQQKEQGQGVVTITEDKSIDELVNGHKPAPATTTTTATPSANAAKTTEKPSTHHEAAQEQAPDNEPEPTATPATGTIHKVTGYRVQAFAGGNSRKDRQKAEQIGNSIRALMPGTAVDVHFYSPRWICRVGNYRTYEEAHQALIQLQQMGYSAATIVKGKIHVRY